MVGNAINVAAEQLEAGVLPLSGTLDLRTDWKSDRHAHVSGFVAAV